MVTKKIIPISIACAKNKSSKSFSDENTIKEKPEITKFQYENLREFEVIISEKTYYNFNWLSINKEFRKMLEAIKNKFTIKVEKPKSNMLKEKLNKIWEKYTELWNFYINGKLQETYLNCRRIKK